ncbi:hypothetical protein KEM55_002420 [Ascosphaera atra]|nr:hypothetical protein KEM55_002420 [Ascosphaera atra]
MRISTPRVTRRDQDIFEPWVLRQKGVASMSAVPEGQKEPEVHAAQGASHLESAGMEDKAVWLAMREDAQAAEDEEREMTFKYALRNWRKALMWSLICSMAVIMEGYSTNLIGNFYAYDQFAKKYGKWHEGRYVIEGKWQSALSVSGNCGAFIGALINGDLIRIFGYKKTFIFFNGFFAGAVFINFFATNVGMQVAGQAVTGITWGVFATLGPSYSMDMTPLALRQYLASYTNICFNIGQFIAAGVLQGLITRKDEWAYRIPWALQWIWPAPLMIIGLWMPESPWWLVRNGRYAEANKVMRRLTSNEQKEKTPSLVAMMIHTNDHEMALQKNSSYMDLLRGVNLRRTEIATVAFCGQVFSGSAFGYNSTYFFVQAGMSSAASYKIGLVGTAISFIGTACSWFVTRWVGRRPLYIWGQAACAACLLIIGCLATKEHQHSNYKWIESAMSLTWLGLFALTIGPMGWTIPTEVGSVRLRQKTICFARTAYYVQVIWSSVLEQYMMDPLEFNWKGKTGFFWFAFAFCTMVWAWFRVPETYGRTPNDIDQMFERHVPTRQFKNYKVEAHFADRNEKTLDDE